MMELHKTFLGKVSILSNCAQVNLVKCRLLEKAQCDSNRHYMKFISFADRIDFYDTKLF